MGTELALGTGGKLKIILHIGRHKTGSTSIQHSLHEAHDDLRAQGVLYPQVDFGDRAHHFLAYLCPDTAALPTYFQNTLGITDAAAQSRSREIWAGIVDDIRRNPPETLLLSTELLWTEQEVAHGVMTRLRELSTDIEVVAYLRNPARLYLSTYQQARLALAPRPGPGPFPDRAILENWDEAAEGQLTLAIFDRKMLHGGDSVRDFRHRFLRHRLPDCVEIPPSEVNVALTVTCLDLLSELRDLGPGRQHIWEPLPRRLIARVKALEARHDLAVRPVLKPAIEEQIIRASSDLHWLRDRHGLVFPEIDYDRIDGVRGDALGMKNPGFADICDYDIEKAARLRALLTDSLLADSLLADSLRLAETPKLRSPVKRARNALRRMRRRIIRQITAS